MATAATHRDTQQRAQPEPGSNAGPGRVESARMHLPQPDASAAVMAPLSQRSHPEPALPPGVGANRAQGRIARARAGYAAVVKQAVMALVRHDASGARHALANVWTGARTLMALLEEPCAADADNGWDSATDSGSDSDSDSHPESVMLKLTVQALEGVPLERLLKISDAMRAPDTERSLTYLATHPNYNRPRAPWPVDRRDQSDLGRLLVSQSIHRFVNMITPRQYLKKAAADAITLFEEIDGSDASVAEKIASYSNVRRELQAFFERLAEKWPGVERDSEARKALYAADRKARQGADALMEEVVQHAITKSHTGIRATSP